MKEFLSENSIDFAYIDITDSMSNLKIYLKFRDNNPAFEEIKKNGRVGVPCIMVNNGEKFIFEKSQINIDELRG